MAQNIVEIILRARNEAGKVLKDTDSQLSQLGKTGMKLGGIMMGVGGAVVGALTAMTVKTAEAGHEFEIASKKIGISASALSQYAYILKLTDTDQGSLIRGLKILSGHMYDAGKGSKESQTLFDTLKTSWHDGSGKLKDLDTMLMDVLGGLKNVSGETEKTAIMSKLMGRGALELAAMLKMPVEEIKRLRDESVALGYAFTETEAAAAGKLADELKTLHAALTGVTREVGKALIPSMIEYVRQGLSVVKGVREWVAEHKTAIPILLQVAGAIMGGGGLIFAIGAFVKLLPIAALAFTSWTGVIGLTIAAIASLIVYLGVIPGLMAKIRDQQVSMAESSAKVSDNIKELAKSSPELAGKLKELGDAYSGLTKARSGKEWAKQFPATTEGYWEMRKALPGAVMSGAVTLADGKAITEYAESVISLRAEVNSLVVGLQAQKATTAALTEEELKAKQAILDVAQAVLGDLDAEQRLEAERKSGRTVLATGIIARMPPKGTKGAIPKEGYEEERAVPDLTEIKLGASEAALAVATASADTYNAVLSLASGMQSAFANAFTAIFTGAQTFGAGMKSLFMGLVNAVVSILSQLAASAIVKWIFNLIVPGSGSALGLFGFAEGGKVKHAQYGLLAGGMPGKDSIPVLAQSGEAFLSVPVVKQIEQLVRVAASVVTGSGQAAKGGGETHNHYHFDNAFDWTSIRRAIRSGEFGRELALSSSRGDF